MAKQNLDVPTELYDKLMEMLFRDRTTPENISAKLVRSLLKELRERKYYEASMQIACKVNDAKDSFYESSHFLIPCTPCTPH